MTDHVARLGVTFPFRGLPMPAHRQVVRQMVDLGYHSVWAGESNGLDAITPLIAAAAWAPELSIGTAIMPVQVEGMLRFLRDSFSGRSLTARYETFDVANFRLSRPVVDPPALLVAALRPRMLKVAATRADGAISTTVAASDLPTIRRHLQADTRLVVWVTVCPSSDADAVRAAVRPAVVPYLCVPAYEAQQRWLGRGDRLSTMWEAWAAGEYRRAIAELPDSVIDDLVVHGSPQQCREHVARYFDAGATEVVMSFDPLVTDPLDALRMLAPSS